MSIYEVIVGIRGSNGKLIGREAVYVSEASRFNAALAAEKLMDKAYGGTTYGQAHSVCRIKRAEYEALNLAVA